jgi:uncharacterized protein YndB with AHSA1/START domain
MATASKGKASASRREAPAATTTARGPVSTRVFDAPRELVFKCFVDPHLYVRWLGPRRLQMTLEKFEPRSGGSWRYVHEDPQSTEHRFHRVFHEALPPQRLIDTFEYENLPEKGHVSLETCRWPIEMA